MNGKLYFLLSIILFTIVSCSKSDSTPEPDLASKVAGTYTLTKLTKKTDGATVTATGSMTITALNKSTAQVRRAIVITKSASSRISSDITNTYTVAQSGTEYTLNYEYDINKFIAIGMLSGSILTTTDQILPGETTTTELVAVYTK